MHMHILTNINIRILLLSPQPPNHNPSQNRIQGKQIPKSAQPKLNHSLPQKSTTIITKSQNTSQNTTKINIKKK
ncbi:hypothetical protein DAI22_02g215100 [Oryza sativa Japonica Group]|nr:hypothetical protein DAI22_02g215100 [Oryza sativa Japonica Group]